MKKTLTASSIAGWLVLAALVARADSVGPKPVKAPSPVYPANASTADAAAAAKLL
jgi:hypothetical protein